MVARKLIVIGEQGVGKTSLVRRLVEREFHEDYLSTLGVDIYTYKVPAAKVGAPSDLQLMIWDIEGQLGTKVFRHPYFQGAAGICVVGDLLRPSTLLRMQDLALICDVEAAGRPCILLANKTDQLPAGQPPEFPAEIDRKRWPLFLTSAKADENVVQAFEHVAKAIVRRGI